MSVTISQQPKWNFEQEPWEGPHDETDINLRAYFDRMLEDKMRHYDPEWTDEQIVEWDGNFKYDDDTAEPELLLGCSERAVYIPEYRRVIEQAIVYRERVRSL